MVELNCVQEPIKSSFCEADEAVKVAYSDLVTSSKETLDSILELQEVQFLAGNLNKRIRFFLMPVSYILFSGQGLFVLDVSFLYFTSFCLMKFYIYKILYMTTDFIVTDFFSCSRLCLLGTHQLPKPQLVTCFSIVLISLSSSLYDLFVSSFCT